MPLQESELQTLAVKYMGRLMLDPKTRETAEKFSDHNAPGGAQKHHQQLADFINGDPELRPSSAMSADDADKLHKLMHKKLSWFFDPLGARGAIECADGVNNQHHP
jgi:hypothetical protein